MSPSKREAFPECVKTPEKFKSLKEEDISRLNEEDAIEYAMHVSKKEACQREAEAWAIVKGHPRKGSDDEQLQVSFLLEIKKYSSLVRLA
jgi:hypothetical protein